MPNSLKHFRTTKAKLLRFIPESRPILVFGLRRSGSTMVTDAICANAGVWYADEPFAAFPDRAGYQRILNELHVPMHSHFFDLDDTQLLRFESFLCGLLGARFREMGTSRRTVGLLKANRVALKLLNTPWMLPFIQGNTDTDIITIVRHPGAQARSVLRQNWQYPVESYIQRPVAMSRYFSVEQIVEMKRIFETGDDWARAILDWVVTSHPLRHATGQRVYKCYYENIIMHPEEFVDRIMVGKCGLRERAAMLEALSVPSGSSGLSKNNSIEHILTKNKNMMLNNWRENTCENELQVGQDILDRFGVTEYRFLE